MIKTLSVIFIKIAVLILFQLFYFMYKNIAITYKDAIAYNFLGLNMYTLVSHHIHIILKFLSKVNNLCDLKSLTYNKNRNSQRIYSPSHSLFLRYQKINSLTVEKRCCDKIL